MANTTLENDDVVEIIQHQVAKPRVVIDLTLEDSDNETLSWNIKPIALSYDGDTDENSGHQNFRQQVAEEKRVGSKHGTHCKSDTPESPLANPKKRVRDKSPRNAPQNLLLLKRIYRNIPSFRVQTFTS